MSNFVKRLMKCGYTKEKALTVCNDFVRNLTIIDLECFVLSKEMGLCG